MNIKSKREIISMEIELNGEKLRVYECGKIEKFGKKGFSKEETWHELKGSISIHPKTKYKCHRIFINGKNYAISRIVYLAHNLNWDIHDVSPNNTIDHIDRNSLNNHISNLRVANRSEQNTNQNRVINQKGYSWDTSNNNWVARIRINGTRKFVGRFKTEEEASQAYLNAVLIYKN
jgi:hypothetical protein